MNNESNYYKINTLNENPAQPGLERRAREYEEEPKKCLAAGRWLRASCHRGYNKPSTSCCISDVPKIGQCGDLVDVGHVNSSNRA
jgi:hypothetical protein